MTPTEFRRHFPIFETTAHLCSCSEGALSDRVIVAMSEFMTSWRIHAAPWQFWMEEVDRARARFAQIIHARPQDVAAVSCASEGAFHVASTLDYRDRSEILTNDLEFPSIAHVWLAQGRRGAEVRFLPHQDGVIEGRHYLEAIGPETNLVSVPVATYANGLRFPVSEITRQAHARGARVFVDAYQAVGVIPIDVEEMGCDYLVAGTLKYLLGAPGIAFLYVRPGVTEDLPPTLTGWFARKEPFAFTPRVLDFADDARRFQTGTPSIPSAFAASAGLSLIGEVDIGDVFRHVAGLAGELQERLLAGGFRLYSPTDEELRGPQVTVLTSSGEEVAQYLKDRGAVVSPRGPAIRISLHYYNNGEDAQHVLGALEACRAEHPGWFGSPA